MWNQLWIQQKGTLIGACVGIFLGVIYLFFGFWKMIVFLCILSISTYIGAQTDKQKTMNEYKEIWRKLTDRWGK
jgi:uncharacterized membrane protein